MVIISVFLLFFIDGGGDVVKLFILCSLEELKILVVVVGHVFYSLDRLFDLLDRLCEGKEGGHELVMVGLHEGQLVSHLVEDVGRDVGRVSVGD